MGGASSKAYAKNENNQIIVNRNELNILNEQVNEVISKSVIDSSKSCNSMVNQLQLLDLSGCETEGNLDVSNIGFKQTAAVDFSCIQISDVQNQVAQEMLSEIMSSVKSSMDITSLNTLTAKADALAKQGFLGIGGSKAESATENIYNLNVSNESTQNLENIVKNSINSEFKANDVQNCINTITQRQIINARNCKAGGDINVNRIKYEQAVEAMIECIQKSEIANKIINKIATELVEVVEADTTGEITVEQESTSEAEARTEGPLDAMANIINAACAPCGQLFGSSGTGFSSICCVILVVIILLGVIGYFIYGSVNKGSSTANPQYGPSKI